MANTDTPLMKQYLEIKSRHQDCLLFFRMGDFYELFMDDAKVAASILEIALTSRNKNDVDPIAMCGVPHHSAVNYINRLVSAGHKVAICEQLEDPAAAKGIVRRDVIRVVSPGTRLDPDTLIAKAPNFTMAAELDARSRKEKFVRWALCDFTTGHFLFGESGLEAWIELAATQGVVEALVPESAGSDELVTMWREAFSKVLIQRVPEFFFENEYAVARISEQFNVHSTDGVHARLKEFAGPVGALIKYFQDTQKVSRIPSAQKLSFWGEDAAMALDGATIRALDLLPPAGYGRVGQRDFSLLSWLDHTKTAMGGRLLRDWILRPLLDLHAIRARQADVIALSGRAVELRKALSEIYDLERLLSRVSLGQGAVANARDLQALSRSLLQSHALIDVLGQVGASALAERLRRCFADSVLSLARECAAALRDELPISTREGGLFQKGLSPELDELITLSENGEQWLVEFESRERAATKINSLKVRFNRVFGYYIEITKANLGSVPGHYIRKQTMVGGERFITDELKEFEEKILTAERKRCDFEYALFRQFCSRFAEQAAAITVVANEVAAVDAVQSLAALSELEGYVLPEFVDSDSSSVHAIDLEIMNGRHPTVEAALANRSKFVANSVQLSTQHPFLLITGPNMGGKSTVMRQTALIVLLAQMGAYVPADSVRLGIVDRIFTRVGSADNIAEGASTFMVEMNEMSFILRQATRRSLILIDEIGRGTSTFDGLSLAWALAQDLAARVGARTLFATHYHELTRLAQELPQIANVRVAAQVEKSPHSDGAIVHFLYKLEPGVAERSYGILVARLAGLPEEVLKTAEAMLDSLETQSRKNKPAAHSIKQMRLELETRRQSRTAPTGHIQKDLF